MAGNLIKQGMLRYLDKIRIICLLCFIFCGKSYHAQINSWNDKQLWVKADKAFALGNYIEAKINYEKLILLDSNNQDINFNLGVCNFKLDKYRQLSKNNFSKVNSKKFVEVNYYLGILAHLDGDFDAAINFFNQYQEAKTQKLFSSAEIDFLINKSNQAKELMSKYDNEIEIVNLGDTVNSKHADYRPLISAEENFIIFTSRRENELFKDKDALGDFYENIYITKKINGNWQTPTILDTTINSKYNDAAIGLTSNGEHLFLFKTSEDLKTGDIYESFFINNTWKTPIKLWESVNSKNYIETSACYTTNNEAIIFSSNRPEGFGGKDLYMIKKLPNGEWGVPFNLGSTINTPYNEDAPFIHPFEDALFFSSEAHQNMGGYDVFKSEFNYETGEFEKPNNLGYPINTVNNDVFYVLNTDATVGYLSSERVDGFGNQDLYKVEFNKSTKNLKVYIVNVYDDSGTVIKNVKITLAPTPSAKATGIYKSNEQTGKMIIISEPEREYELTIHANGYKTYTTIIVLKENYQLSFKLETQ